MEQKALNETPWTFDETYVYMEISDKDDKTDNQIYSMIQCANLSCMQRKAKDKKKRIFYLPATSARASTTATVFMLIDKNT